MSSCSHLCFFRWVWDFLAAVSFVVLIEIVNDWKETKKGSVCVAGKESHGLALSRHDVSKNRHDLILGAF